MSFECLISYLYCFYLRVWVGQWVIVSLLITIMKQKSHSLQSNRPKQIKLVPFTPLPKLRLNGVASPSDGTSTLPFISAKSKAKTSPPEQHLGRKERMRTEQAGQKQQQSTSFRLISKFIYRHLQKKLAYQTQLYSHHQHSPSVFDESGSHLDSDYRTKQQLFDHESAHVGSPFKEASRSQILKLKNKLSLRAKALQRLSTEPKPQRSRYANIDSYFDLSCLDSCEQRGR